MSSIQVRTYLPIESAEFGSATDLLGEYSNSAYGFPIIVNDVFVGTAEALFFALRFPDFPDIQKLIINQAGQDGARHTYNRLQQKYGRSDWNRIMVTCMRWVLRAKLLQNWDRFSSVLLASDKRMIVKVSTNGDEYWGASRQANGCLVGQNVMGRLLQELRENIKTGSDAMTNDFSTLEPLLISNFCLYRRQIQKIKRD